MTETRRDFLARVARGAAYAAPVVVTLSAPEGLMGQGPVSQKGNKGCPPGQEKMGLACAPVEQPSLQRLPTDRPPPGSDPGSVTGDPPLWRVRPPGGRD